MRRWHGVLLVAAAAAVAVASGGLLSMPASAARAGAGRTAGISWGRAERLGGRPLTSGLSALSCWSVTNCVAGGVVGVRGVAVSFVAVERNGQWGRTERLPGMAALSRADWLNAVSCAAGGYCVAGGAYGYKGHSDAFVATLRKGQWQKPLQVPGTYVRNHQTEADSVWCLVARHCVVAGDNDLGAFAASQVNGTWQPAQILHLGGGFTKFACWSPDGCVAARVLTAAEINGIWGAPQPIPGDSGDQVAGVACARDGYCTVAAGPFAASGLDGTFGTAVTAVLTGGPMWCPSAGSCVMASGSQVVSQNDGIWGTPEQLPGTAAEVNITTLTCWSAGNCAVGGSYVAVAGGQTEPFVASEIDGRWSKPEPVPGITALNKVSSPYSGVQQLSCPSPGHCTAAGTYVDARDQQRAFVTAP
jgi:hypothetical protein